MKACILFTSDNEVAKDWLGKFNSREPLDICGQKYLIDEISTDYEPRFSGVTIKMYPVYQAKTPESPKNQEAWDGVGLPPAGLGVEVMQGGFPSVAFDWQACKVLAINIGSDERPQVITRDFHGDVAIYYPGIDSVYFRPIKTAEQLAEEERKSQLEVMHKIYMEGASEHKGGLAALYDAGYKLAK